MMQALVRQIRYSIAATNIPVRLAMRPAMALVLAVAALAWLGVEGAATAGNGAPPIPNEADSIFVSVEADGPIGPPVSMRIDDLPIDPVPTAPGNEPAFPDAPATVGTAFDGFDFDDNVTQTGSGFIPPDPIGAAGPNSLIAVGNVVIEARTKTGTLLWIDSLRDFFAPLAPTTPTFDPKIVYDHYENRFVVVTLERVFANANPDPGNASRILLAVSKDATPAGPTAADWHYAAINSKLPGGTERWADYPGFEVDEEAIYITANMFEFPIPEICDDDIDNDLDGFFDCGDPDCSPSPCPEICNNGVDEVNAFDPDALVDCADPDCLNDPHCGGPIIGRSLAVRLWIVDKGTASGFYAGGAAITSGPHDPYLSAGIIATTMPALVFGGSGVGTGIGTFLVSYSGLTDGVNEAVQVVRINNPLGTVTFTHEFVSVGDIESSANLGVPLPDAPQRECDELIEVNDRRALDAVWRDGSLWLTTTILPASGHTTAHWFRLDTINVEDSTSDPFFDPITLADQGNIDGEDITLDGNPVSTYFPSVAVNSAGDAKFGFSASSSTLFAGAYVTGRQVGDAAGAVQATETVRAGDGPYHRDFGRTRNRWGDYSGIALDPTDDNLFWVFNQYAQNPPSNDCDNDGKWGTAWAACAFDLCAAVPAEECCDPITGARTIIDDGNACTTDVCNADGTVTHTPIVDCCLEASECFDGDPCTDDICQLNQCQNPFNTAPCNDGDDCTDNDTCSIGFCMGSPIICPDDGNECTDEICDAGQCIPVDVQDGEECNDGDPCTEDDFCNDGACEGNPVICPDDGNPCTDDVCVAGVCDSINVVGPCDDGDACTESDMCVAGVCGGTPIPNCAVCPDGTCQAGEDVCTCADCATQDSDGDGTPDVIDNCIDDPNPDQTDSDGDCFGNVCDADKDNDGDVDADDMAVLISRFGSADEECDLNLDGVVGMPDLLRLLQLFGQPPGPSCEISCD